MHAKEGRPKIIDDFLGTYQTHAPFFPYIFGGPVLRKLGEDLVLQKASCCWGLEKDAEERKQDQERSSGRSYIWHNKYTTVGLCLLFWGDATETGCPWAILVVLHKSAILWGEVMLYGDTEAKWKKFRQIKSHVRYLLKEQFIMEAFKESTHVPHDSLVFGPHNVEGRSTPCCGPEKQQKP